MILDFEIARLIQPYYQEDIEGLETSIKLLSEGSDNVLKRRKITDH